VPIPQTSCAGFEDADLIATGNASPSISSPPLAQIEDALDQLLTKLLAERKREQERKRKAGTPSSLRVISCAELLAEPLPSDADIWRDAIIEHPITGALELAIHEVGEVLFQRGGTDLMREVLERVAERHPKSYGHRATIMDHKWDGIGERWHC
jgi:hypothetical protein